MGTSPPVRAEPADGERAHAGARARGEGDRERAPEVHELVATWAVERHGTGRAGRGERCDRTGTRAAALDVVGHERVQRLAGEHPLAGEAKLPPAVEATAAARATTGDPQPTSPVKSPRP